MPILALLFAILTCPLLGMLHYSNKPLESRKKTQEIIDQFVDETSSLLRNEEAGMSPMGRSPVVDVLLTDPFYMPTYADIVTNLIKKNTADNTLFQLTTSLWRAAGIPLSEITPAVVVVETVPEPFRKSFPEPQARKLYGHWLNFLSIHREVQHIFSVLTDEEKKWLRENYRKFFSGDLDPEIEFDFFTTEGNHPLRFYTLGSRLDLAKLADCARKLILINDAIYLMRDELTPVDDLIWEEQGLMFHVSSRSGINHIQNADFFIDCGGSNTIHTNAGGTEGSRPLALHIDFKGNNTYEGVNFVQGSGFLGIGMLVNYGGNNIYRADAFAQGSGFFGIGILANLKGNNQFISDFASQSFATFGFSLVWNKEGSNRYQANQGLSQAASSTLGVAFLVDNQGGNTYVNGQFGKGGTIAGGIGQGGSTGVRSFPWLNNPNLYGGLSFLYVGGGSNHFKTPWLGQGSAYFLGAGLLVSEGSNDVFEAEYDAQGQGLHSAAGLFFKKGNHNRFKGGWGSLGVSGDRSIGMFINTGSHNDFEGTDQAIGSSRKPRSIGVFVNYGGNNTYRFDKTSNAKLQLPEAPNQWSRALFLEVGRDSEYPHHADGMVRGENRVWGIDAHSLGIATNEPVSLPLHKNPTIDFPFDPINGWPTNTAYRPLVGPNAGEITTANYDRRRQIYEAINVIRFNDRTKDPDLSHLLKADQPVDAFTYGILWALRNKDKADLTDIKQALKKGNIKDRLARKMAVNLAGSFWSEDAESTFHEIMLKDPAEEVRYAAALNLAVHATNTDWLKEGAQSDSEAVRYAIAKGLTERKIEGVKEVIDSLLKDPSFYVRRAAALAALSLGDKEGMSVVLETLQYETLDTDYNYGENIYKHLANYLGVDFKLDKQAWIDWWSANKETFQFPTCD